MKITIFWLPVISTQIGLRGFESYWWVYFNQKDFNTFALCMDDINRNKQTYIKKWYEIAQLHDWKKIVQSTLIPYLQKNIL